MYASHGKPFPLPRHNRGQVTYDVQSKHADLCYSKEVEQTQRLGLDTMGPNRGKRQKETAPMGGPY